MYKLRRKILIGKRLYFVFVVIRLLKIRLEAACLDVNILLVLRLLFVWILTRR